MWFYFTLHAMRIIPSSRKVGRFHPLNSIDIDPYVEIPSTHRFGSRNYLSGKLESISYSLCITQYKLRFVLGRQNKLHS